MAAIVLRLITMWNVAVPPTAHLPRRAFVIATTGCIAGLAGAALLDFDPVLRFLFTLCAVSGSNPLVVGLPKLVFWLRRSGRRLMRWLQDRTWQFGLRTLFVATLLCAMAMVGWRQTEPYRRERLQQEDFMRTIESIGGAASANVFGPSWFPLRRVWYVDLSHKPIQNEDLDALTRHAAAATIGFLNLESTKVTDEGLVYLNRLPALQALNVNNCRVTDVGIRELSKMKRLDQLMANSTRLSDAGLSDLESLPLGVLIIHDTLVTRQGVQHFREMLPDCYIVGLAP